MKVKRKLVASILIIVLIAVVFQARVWLTEKVLLGYALDEEGDSQKILVSGGLQRSYFVHLPSRYNEESDAVPLVLMLHGAGSNARMNRRITGMNETADKENFIAVYPNGTGLFNFMLSWNAGYCCNYVEPLEVDDVAFLNLLISTLSKEYNIDLNKIYIAGFSNGGMMAYKLACELSDRIAAIAAISSAMPVDECQPSDFVSVLVFHGKDDTVIPYQGGGATKLYIKPFMFKHKPVVESISFWVKHNLCQGVSFKEKTSRINKEFYNFCAEETSVELYVADATGHAWPGGKKSWFLGDETEVGLSASQVVWDFFEKHSKI